MTLMELNGSINMIGYGIATLGPAIGVAGSSPRSSTEPLVTPRPVAR